MKPALSTGPDPAAVVSGDPELPSHVQAFNESLIRIIPEATENCGRRPKCVGC